ncbi:hydroxyacid dehydrogenase [Kouleothrix sp.]|uniref:hydroxyacid dehydrogenase n=1 Tax=Kouleothrix sp. TaxID=2779161 RepID=UPI00391B781E
MQPYRVWAHAAFAPEALAELAPIADVQAGSAHDAGWLAAAASFDALILDGVTLIDGATLDQIGPRVRVLARTGIGVDRIDLAAATERGVLVVNTPDGPTESTAQHAIALLLSLTKRVATSDRSLRAGQWQMPTPGLELLGATLGLVGLGRIGGRVAEIARALGMRVLAFDPYIAAGRAAALGVTPTASLEDLLASADVVSLHCPAIPETYRLIDAAALARMRPGSYLINVARGAVVDEDALVSALRDGHLAGAGLDVYESEPAAADHPLFSLPNTVCTPHIASYTTAGVLKMQVMACQQVALALRGERPTELVNPQVWGRHRVAGPQ